MFLYVDFHHHVHNIYSDFNFSHFSIYNGYKGQDYYEATIHAES